MPRPKPFSRPSIALSTEKKEWAWVPVHSLREGDMVRDFGLLTGVHDAMQGVTLTFLSGTTLDLEEGETVFAFVKV